MHGEDVIALAILDRSGCLPSTGLYVDVGAFHPTYASNTAVLSERGWRGVCIEPNPFMAARLREARPADVVLEVAVGSSRRRGYLNLFSEWGSSNTLDDDFAAFISSTQDVEVARRIDVDVMPLAEILSEHVPADATIDFISVDVEGMDLEVLESSDWTRFRPSLVAAEDLGLDLADVRSSPIFRFMTGVRYRLVAHAVFTSFYLRWDDEAQWIDVQRQEHDTKRNATRSRWSRRPRSSGLAQRRGGRRRT
jgi:FkbM family methyltransferase